MTIINKITMDLANRGIERTVDLVQGDRYGRLLQITLLANNVPWPIPDGAVAVVRYQRSDGKGGVYGSLPDGSAAYSISGNVLTVIVTPQVCAVPGRAGMTIALMLGEMEINTFVIHLNVAGNPGIGMGAEEAEEDPDLLERVAALEAYSSKVLSEIAKSLQVSPLFANSVDECTDISKLYVLPDGYIYGYMKHMTGGYTNQIRVSTDTDGSIYNGTGYREKSRCNSSGEVVDLDTVSAPQATFVTGFIPAKTGDVIRLKNCFIHATDNETITGENYGAGPFALRSGLYNADKGSLGVFAYGYLAQGMDTDKITYTADSEGYVTEFTIVKASTAYVRLCLVPNGNPADAIVTVNEAMVGGEATEEYEWVNTGHAFVPADYEDRILALESAVRGDLPVYGIVDDENNILLSGSLSKGTYTLKYLSEDGTATQIGTFTMK